MVGRMVGRSRSIAACTGTASTRSRRIARPSSSGKPSRRVRPALSELRCLVQRSVQPTKAMAAPGAAARTERISVERLEPHTLVATSSSTTSAPPLGRCEGVHRSKKLAATAFWKLRETLRF